MKNKCIGKLNIVALTISVLPLATLIPAFLKIALPNEMRTIWAGTNIFFTLIGLLLSIICVWNRERRNAISIIALIVSLFWLLLMVGIVVLALILNILP